MKIIFKKNFSTIVHELEVKPTDSGKDLRTLIADLEKVAPEEIQLKFWGDVIQNDVFVSDYKMKDQDNIIYQVIKNLKKPKTDDGSGENPKEVSTLKLTLKQEGQPDLDVDVVAEDSIAIVKTKLEQKHNVPGVAVRLKYNGLMMFPAKRLVDYGIEGDVTVEMIVDQKLAEQARLEKAKMEEEKKQGNGDGKKGEVHLKVKFHDGEEKTVALDSEDTMEALRLKLLALKPIEKENYKLKVVVGGETRSDETKIGELGLSDKVVVATVLEKVKGADDLSLTVKRAIGTDKANITVGKNQTTEELKKLLEGPFNAAVKDMTVENNGKALEDGKTLAESGVEDGATLTIAIVKKGLFSN